MQLVRRWRYVPIWGLHVRTGDCGHCRPFLLFGWLSGAGGFTLVTLVADACTMQVWNRWFNLRNLLSRLYSRRRNLFRFSRWFNNLLYRLFFLRFSLNALLLTTSLWLRTHLLSLRPLRLLLNCSGTALLRPLTLFHFRLRPLNYRFLNWWLSLGHVSRRIRYSLAVDTRLMLNTHCDSFRLIRQSWQNWLAFRITFIYYTGGLYTLLALEFCYWCVFLGLKVLRCDCTLHAVLAGNFVHFLGCFYVFRLFGNWRLLIFGCWHGWHGCDGLRLVND